MATTPLAQAARSAFARHETFAPRFGWLHKAYLQVSENNEVFLRDDATVTLGVGKNMVNAIRYWSSAFKLTKEYPKGGNSRAFAAAPTWRARWLLDENGADPYLEDPASLWLLHWWLLSPRCATPAWWIAFHLLPSARFTEPELTELIERHVRLAGWDGVARASVEKDVDCMTKMYAPRRASAASKKQVEAPGSFEDFVDCPFRELGLLESVDPGHKAPRTWRFTSTTRTSLPPAVVAYACLDYAAEMIDSNAGSIAVARLANEPGGPGRAFRIREPELVQSLETICEQNPKLSLNEAVGQRALVFHEQPRKLAWDVLDGYYGRILERGCPTEEEWNARYPQLKSADTLRQPTDTADVQILEEVQ
ncbi:DUF4007 family protein [Nocardia gipuzkoensis]